MQTQYVFNQRKFLFWNTLFYISWGVLALWLILKVTGVINTPVWLEYGVPVSSLLVGILALYSNVLDSIKQLTVGLATLTVKTNFIEKKVDHVDMKVDNLDDKVDILDNKVNHLEIKVDNLDKDVDFLKRRS